MASGNHSGKLSGETLKDEPEDVMAFEATFSLAHFAKGC